MPNVVLVELDALLDTRLALVSVIDQAAAVRLVTSDDYYKRQSDDLSVLSNIPHDQYQTAWAQRTADILPHSIKTHIPILLNELINRLEVQEENTPDAEIPELEINVWPYVDLTEQEREQIGLAVLVHAGIQTVPSVVCIDPKHLTPQLLKRRYSGLILYNFRDWLIHHIEHFSRCICPDLTILAPALFNGEVVEAKDVITDPDFRADLSVLTMTELACIEFFQLNYIDVKYFSIWRA